MVWKVNDYEVIGDSLSLSLSLSLKILLDPTHPHTRLTFEKIPLNSVVLNSPFSPLFDRCYR